MSSRLNRWKLNRLLSQLLKAPNADELIRDLAILSELSIFQGVLGVCLNVILVSQRGVVFFRDQDINIDEQKVLGQKLGELSGKPASSKLHVHPITEETSELGDEVSIITSDRRGEYDKYDKTQLSA